MVSETTIVWLLRILTITVVLIPIVVNYFASESLQDFIVPDLTIPLSSTLNIPHSLQVYSIDYSIAGDECLLNLGLFNAGSIGIGLKELDCRITVASMNMSISGRLVLQSPFIVKPAGRERVSLSLSVENGIVEDFLRLLSQESQASLFGEATVLLDSAELPISLEITSLSTGFLPPG
ncbi:MAG: hypothetical protein HA496_07295 [Thaumarchaeota archaeon]|jgi:LEA14-like dessication related protein|nr:hypothetical protein [Nitrososphaerota archaeon]